LLVAAEGSTAVLLSWVNSTDIDRPPNIGTRRESLCSSTYSDSVAGEAANPVQVQNDTKQDVV